MRNVDSDRAKTTSSGSAFHIRGAETLNVRLPTVYSLNDGTTTRRWCWQSVVPDDQAYQLLGRGTAVSRKTMYVRTAILY